MFFRLLWGPALGVYITSLVKDLLCSPRPFAPPVTRLSMSYFGPRWLNCAHRYWSLYSVWFAPFGVRLPFNPHHQQCFYRTLPLFARPPALLLRILNILNKLLHLSRGHHFLCLQHRVWTHIYCHAFVHGLCLWGRLGGRHLGSPAHLLSTDRRCHRQRRLGR